MEELLTRAIEDIIPRGELEAALKSKRKLRLKLGVDPSSPDIHLGHSVVLRKLRRFQELGHTVIFLIGDATARIGDPSGKNKTRPVLSEADIERNAKTYLDQVGKILDVEAAEIRRNSEWLDKLDFAGMVKLTSNFTVAQLIERDDFANRLAAGADLSLHELLYPVMQAYDSVMLEADVEFGGSDQRFNNLAGRALQKKMGQRPQSVILTKLLVGTDGANKMSKSLGNYIGLDEPAPEMFGKVMSIPDDLIAPYYELCTDIEQPVIDELVKTLAAGANPRDAKASLAREIVRLYHGDQAAQAAEDAFNRKFRDKEFADEDIIVKAGPNGSSVIDFLFGTDTPSDWSRSEIRRTIQQGGVKVNGEVIKDEKTALKHGDVVSVGKRRAYKLEAR